MPTFIQRLCTINLPPARTMLLVSLGLLLPLSLLMITSASMPLATYKGLDEMKFFWSHGLYIIVGVVAACIVYHIPLRFYCNVRYCLLMWAAVLFLLAITAMVAVPINGAKRWISMAGFTFQAAELAKMVMVIVASEYVVRRTADMRNSILGGWRLFILYGAVCGFLIMQPDYGSTVVLGATLLVIAWVSGAPFKEYVILASIAIVIGGLGIWFADYRRERLLSFLNPFDDMRNSDYQLSRSLIAFGRGEFSGLGYGDSIQKLSHLPEAHTDFILSVTGEELGLLGVVFVLFLEMMIVMSMMMISRATLKRRQMRLSYMVFGFATVIFGQILINAGMAMGMIPTKGLTLPFYSYGGSALLVNMMMVGFILKVDKDSPIIEHRQQSRSY